jgi:5'(3')-deoxyribonucleotidase
VSNPKNVFLLDMDGFLFNLHKKVAARLSDKIGELITVKDCTNNSPAKGFAHVRPEASRWVKDMLAEPGFYRDLEPMPSAQWAVQEIVEMGLRPVILSSLGDAPQCATDKVASLDQHFRGLIHPRDYCFTSCKDLVDGMFYGDDGAEYLKSWKRNHPSGVTVTFASSYTTAADADWFAANWIGLIQRVRDELSFIKRHAI